MASTDEQKTSVPVPKPITYRSTARHMISTSIGYDTSVVCVLAVCEQVADPADPAQTCFDVVQLQYLNGLTHPQVVNNVALTLKRPPIPGSEFDLVVDETVIFGAGDAFKGLGDPQAHDHHRRQYGNPGRFPLDAGTASIAVKAHIGLAPGRAQDCERPDRSSGARGGDP